VASQPVASKIEPSPRTLTGLSPLLLTGIQSASFDGLVSLRIRPLEVGGLISAPAPGADADELQLIDCEHRFGPTFQLSDRDRAAFSEVVGEIHASSRVLAGYFRSGADGRTEPSAADLDIVRELAPEARFILIAEPFRSGRVLVRKFERNAGGEWERTEQDSVATSSFERAPSAPPVPRRIVSRALPLVQQPIPVPILPVKTAALTRPARGARPAWFLAAGGVVLAAASGFGGYALRDRTGTAAPIKIVIGAPPPPEQYVIVPLAVEPPPIAQPPPTEQSRPVEQARLIEQTSEPAPRPHKKATVRRATSASESRSAARPTPWVTLLEQWGKTHVDSSPAHKKN
jgi:hypothetical protein